MQTEGDAFFVAFGSASDAVAACLDAQRGLAAHDWPADGVIRVRMGMHTGEATPIGRDYVSLVVHEAARVAGAGHGGQTLVSQTTAVLAAALPDGSRLRDLGEHQLKDFRAPLRLFQLDHADLPNEFPPIRSLERAAHNLPTQLTSFIGREAQITELVGHVRSERLVTLAGAGGAGKTRLAIEVAGQVVDGVADGVWLVELAASSGDGVVASVVGQTLNAPRPPGQEPDEALKDFLRAKSLLIVLDNCEHLLDQCAEFVEAVLRAAPAVRVLATSREALGVPGELTWRVPSLDVGTEGEAVELFVERARLERPDFALSDNDRGVVVRICRRLDGLPLAIEIAAARCRAMAVADIADRLDDRFRLLTGGARRELGRQQTLRAAVDWSYDLLDDADRALLRRLSVFSGGCTLAMAEEVGADETLDSLDILDGLTRLIDKSLVVADDGEGVARYRLLETVRDYASDKLLAGDEAPTARAAHLQCVINLTSRAALGLCTSDERLWLPRLDTELENIRAALAWATETDPTTALHIAGDLMLYWWARGLFAEGRQWIESGFDAGGADGSAIEARAHGAACWLSCMTGDADSARAHADADAAIGIDDALGQSAELDSAVSWATLDLANQLEGDDPDRSTSLVKQAIERAERSGQLFCVGRAHQHLTHLALHAGDLDTALAYVDRSVQIIQLIDNRLGVNRIYLTRAQVLEARGDIVGALASADVALSAANASGDRLGIALASRTWTIYAKAVGRFDEAAAMAVTAVNASADLGRSGNRWVAALLYSAWSVMAAGHDKALARSWLEEAVGLLDDATRYGPLGRTTQFLLGEVCRLEHDLAAAEKWLVGTLSASACDDEIDRSARMNLALVAIERGDNATARGYLLEVAGALTDESATDVLASIFDAAAQLACAEADHRIGATLTGAVDTIFAATPAAGRDPVYVAERDTLTRACEAALGPEALAHALAAGSALTIADALGLARTAAGYGGL